MIRRTCLLIASGAWLAWGSASHEVLAQAAKSAAPKTAVAATTSSAAASASPAVSNAGRKTGLAPSEAAATIDKLLAKEVLGDAVTSKSDKVASTTSSKNEPKKPKLAELTDDATFLRRVMLDITGKIPSPEELTRFTLDTAKNKRARAVEGLLDTPLYGENWAHYWRDVILSRRTEERALLVTSALTQYLTDEFNKNTPWDQLARSFVTATGDVREIGSTAVIMSQMAETNDVTAEMSRIFLGVQIACAQCHDHPTDRWKRTQFHELAAFFPRIAIRPRNDGQMRSFEVASVERDPRARGNNAARRGSTEHYMPDLNEPTARGTLMQPVFFLTGDKLEPGQSDQERRTAVAAMMTDAKNPWFARAFVNRVWSELVGEGFYEPVDDLGPDRECLATNTLDYIADQFVAQRHDMKWLFRAIMATQAYQRESRSRRGPNDKPFLASCPQRLRGDQLYTALTEALGIKETTIDVPGRPGARHQLSATPRGRFNAAFGYDPSTLRDEVSGSIPQALLMMNSQDVNRPINAKSPETALAQVLSTAKNEQGAVLELYLRTLAREPSPAELRTCLAYIRRIRDKKEAYEDILWSLVNSTEFLYRK